jgi:hypothetical protein
MNSKISDNISNADYLDDDHIPDLIPCEKFVEIHPVLCEYRITDYSDDDEVPDLVDVVPGPH